MKIIIETRINLQQINVFSKRKNIQLQKKYPYWLAKFKKGIADIKTKSIFKISILESICC